MPTNTATSSAWRNKENRYLLLGLCAGTVALVLSYLFTGLQPASYRRLLPSSTMKGVERVHITGKDLKNTLTKEPFTGRWRINGKYLVDPYARETLWNTLNEARTQRRLSVEEAKEIDKKMTAEGYKVVVSGKSQPARHFEVYGDVISGNSYVRFPGEAQLYALSVAGHAYYVAGIFSLTALQWKDRLFLDYDRKWLKTLTLDHSQAGREGWTITLSEGTAKLQGEPQAQVNPQRLQSYVGLFANFYINEYILPGQLALYDSILHHHTPFAVLKIASTKADIVRKINIYANESEDFYLLRDEDKGLALCEKGRYGAFLKDRKYFRKQADNFSQRK